MNLRRRRFRGGGRTPEEHPHASTAGSPRRRVRYGGWGQAERERQPLTQFTTPGPAEAGAGAAPNGQPRSSANPAEGSATFPHVNAVRRACRYPKRDRLPRALTRRALEDRIEEFADGREIAPPDGWHGAEGAAGE